MPDQIFATRQVVRDHARPCFGSLAEPGREPDGEPPITEPASAEIADM
jgi:hypothetical protein